MAISSSVPAAPDRTSALLATQRPRSQSPRRFGTRRRERTSALGLRQPGFAARQLFLPRGEPGQGRQRPIRAISFAMPRSMASTR